MKKMISAIASAVLAASALTAVYSGSAAAQTGSKLSPTLIEQMEKYPAETYVVSVFLDDSDKPDFDALAAEMVYPKTAEEYEAWFSLSEVERVDKEKAARLQIVSGYYTKKAQDFVKSSGLPEDAVVSTSQFTSLVTLRLTEEQIYALEGNDYVGSIGFIDVTGAVETDITTVAPTQAADTSEMTKEEFLDLMISETPDFSDGGVVYRGDLKFDAVDNGYGYDLIVYGIPQKYYEPGVRVSSECLKLNFSDYTIGGDAAFFSGCVRNVSAKDSTVYDKNFTMIFYVDNVLPGYASLAPDIVTASINRPYDIAQYIYPTIKSGDVDNDGKITAADASLVLMAYSYLSTGKKMALNSELFDYNNDGMIDASDASDILKKYAELSTMK